MAARRSNKRKRRNRGRFGILYQFLSLVIILVVIAAGCVVFFRVDEVTVDGESKYTAEEIIAASGIEQGDNLFLISPVQTGRTIASVLPYVDNVNVRRALPDGVVITVTECMPAAVIQGNGSWWIIDAKGKVLEQTASGTGAAVVSGLTALLPVEGTRLAVEDADSAKLNSLLQLLRAFSDRGMAEKVSSIDLTSTANIILEYDGRFTVKIPMNPENFALKVRALDETVAQLQTNESGSIDLTREDKVYFDQTGGGK